MAKLQNIQIGQAELLDYLNSVSDFSFELSVLKMLREMGIDCEHGGHYEDPVTNKSREFDIRAVKTIDRFRIRMAIECKNIRENFPILISCVPRHAQEAYSEVVLAIDPKPRSAYDVAIRLNEPRARPLRMKGVHCMYQQGMPVGKSTVQVGKASDGSLTANDSELYEKWGQCLSSMDDLVRQAYWDGEGDGHQVPFFSAAFAFVVVPNGRLWAVDYDADGGRTSDPHPVDRCSCFIGREYEIGTKLARSDVRLSHLEVVTTDGLREFVSSFVATKQAMDCTFKMEGLAEAYSASLQAR